MARSMLGRSPGSSATRAALTGPSVMPVVRQVLLCGLVCAAWTAFYLAPSVAGEMTGPSSSTRPTHSPECIIIHAGIARRPPFLRRPRLGQSRRPAWMPAVPAGRNQHAALH